QGADVGGMQPALVEAPPVVGDGGVSVVQQGAQALPLQFADLLGREELGLLEFSFVAYPGELAPPPQGQRGEQAANQGGVQRHLWCSFFGAYLSGKSPHPPNGRGGASPTRKRRVFVSLRLRVGLAVGGEGVGG